MLTRTIKCGHCRQQGHNRRTCPIYPLPLRNVTIRRKVKKVKKIKKLKKILRKKAAPAPAKPVVETCSICMDDCKDKTCTLECGHKFHTKCIFTWFNKNNNCPLCRAEVIELKNNVECNIPYDHFHLPHLPRPRLIKLATIQIVDYLEAFGHLPNEIQRENMTNCDFIISVMTCVAGILQESDELDYHMIEVDDWWNHL